MTLPVVRPARWKVRTRSTVVAAVVVTVGMGVASAAMLVVLYHTLQRSAQQAAEARAVQLVDQLRSDAPADLDPGLLSTDGQVGVIQILDRRGAVVAASSDAPATPLVSQTVSLGQSVFLGHLQIAGEDGDYWITAHGADTPSGPVTVVVGGAREPVESIIATVAVLLAVSGPLVVVLVAWATYVLVGGALRPVSGSGPEWPRFPPSSSTSVFPCRRPEMRLRTSRRR